MRSGCWAGHFLVIGNASSLLIRAPSKPQLQHLKWIIETGEYRGPLAAESHIDITHDEGTCDAAKSHAVDLVDLIERQCARAVEHAADVDEGRELYLNRGRDGIEGDDVAAQLD